MMFATSVFALFLSACASELYDALSRVPFLNEGVTRANDSFHYEVVRAVGEGQNAIYLEADNVSCTQCVWSDQGRYYTPHPYLFKDGASPPQGWQELGDADWNDPNAVLVAGGDNIVESEQACQARCAAQPGCGTGLFLSGSVRRGECWLAAYPAAQPRTDFCGRAAGQRCQAFKRTGTGQAGVYLGDTPASGMRSAVPLGGIGAGSFELRGDGSFHEWIIHNAGPHGAAKIQNYPFASLAMAVDGESRVLRTHPEVGLGVQGVEALKYSGTYPVSKLEVQDSLTASLHAAVYAFSPVHVGDMVASSRPAAAFVLSVENTAETASEVSFMLNLPLAIEVDQARPGTPIAGKDRLPASSAEACRRLCLAEAGSACQSWQWSAKEEACALQSDAPWNLYLRGITSGLRDAWSASADGSQCLTLSRPGPGPMHGNLSICASAESCAAAGCWDHTVSDDAASNFQWLSSGAGKPDPAGAYGAVKATTRVQPHERTTLQVTLGWFFPNRDHFNYNSSDSPKAFKPFGNKYATWFPGGSAQAAWADTDSAPGAKRTAALLAEVQTISAYHSAFMPTPGLGESSSSATLPPWLQDLLVNSLSHSRDSMWWETCPNCHMSKDSRVDASSWGIWRQWEANDCPDIDSIHNDGERHIPYIMFYTDGTRSKLAAWAGNQGADGMLAEQVHNANPDQPEGRIMSDSSSMFNVYLLELMRWANDTRSLELYYPTAKRAAQWHMAKAQELGVPEGLQTTYDILRFDEQQLSAYSSAFHLLAMRATMELATLAGDTAFAGECEAAFKRGQQAFDIYQWNSSAGHYSAASHNCTREGGCTGFGSFADAFYAQVLAYSLGLGDLLQDPSKLDQHLSTTAKLNCVHTDVADGTLQEGCPHGLVIMTGRGASPPAPGQSWAGESDLQIWEMATYDHAVLAIHRGVLSAEAALAFAEGSGKNYAQHMNDQWATAGITSNDGYPSITTHYGYHMTSWHLVFALSGQVADLSAAAPSLTFAPKLKCDYTVPVMLPGILGRLSCVGQELRLMLTVGELFLAQLSVSGSSYPALPVTLQTGEAVTWSSQTSLWV